MTKKLQTKTDYVYPPVYYFCAKKNDSIIGVFADTDEEAIQLVIKSLWNKEGIKYIEDGKGRLIYGEKTKRG